MNDIVIIGSGIAGYSVATEIRKYDEDVKITMITTDRGDYYYKPSLSTAFANNKEADALVMFPAATMSERLNINIMPHETINGSELKDGIVTTSKGDIPFAKCVLACGAEPYKLNIEGADDIQSVNNLDDYIEFRKKLKENSKVAIIGAGLVGSEFAADLSKAGYDVTVFGDEPYPLSTLIPEQVAEIFMATMSRNGVKWVLGDLVSKVRKDQGKYMLTTASAKDYSGFDMVLSAIGIKPRLDIAKNAGLEVNKGICINNKCQTSINNIYAIGDCAEFNNEVLLYIAPIKQCALALGKTLTGNPTKFGYPPMPVVIKTPQCPMLSCLPAVPCKAQVSGDATGLTIKYFDEYGKMKGFVLSGSAVRNRMASISEMS